MNSNLLLSLLKISFGGLIGGAGLKMGRGPGISSPFFPAKGFS